MERGQDRLCLRGDDRDHAGWRAPHAHLSNRVPAIAALIAGRSPRAARRAGWCSCTPTPTTGRAQPANNSRSTKCRSERSKYFFAHASLVDRNQPADRAACCLSALGFVVFLAFAAAATLSRKLK